MIAKCDGAGCKNNAMNYRGSIYKLAPTIAVKLHFDCEHLCADCIEDYFSPSEIKIDHFFKEVKPGGNGDDPQA
jgi:hypothetical protein